MTPIIDKMLEYIERQPARSIVILLSGAATILVAYWTTSGYFGEAAKTALGLVLFLGAVVLTTRNMTRRAKTEEYAAQQSRDEIAVSDAVQRYESGQALSLEDVAALRRRRENIS